MQIEEKLNKINLISKTISPYNFYGHQFCQEDYILKIFLNDLIEKQDVNISQINKEFNIDFIDMYKSIINYLLENKMIVINEDKMTRHLEVLLRGLIMLYCLCPIK